MPTIADLTNAPSEYEWEGKVYKFREATLPECGRYQRWLEDEARNNAAASTNLPEDDRRRLLRDVNADVTAGIYAWGGEVCVRSLTTPRGIAKYLAIICEADGLTFRAAEKMVGANILEFARKLKLFAEEAEHDPEKKAELAKFLKSRGFAGDFLSTPSSPSPTAPTAAPTPPNSSPSSS